MNPKEQSHNSSKAVVGLIVLSLVLAIVAVLLGWKFTQARSDKNKVSTEKDAVSKQLNDTKSQLANTEQELLAAQKKTPVTQTDKEKIQSYLVAECGAKSETAALGKITFDVIKTDFIQASYLCKGATEGPTAVFKKSGSVWVQVWWGVGPIDDSIRATYKIPSDLPKY